MYLVKLGRYKLPAKCVFVKHFYGNPFNFLYIYLGKYFSNYSNKQSTSKKNGIKLFNNKNSPVVFWQKKTQNNTLAFGIKSLQTYWGISNSEHCRVYRKRWVVPSSLVKRSVPHSPSWGRPRPAMSPPLPISCTGVISKWSSLQLFTMNGYEWVLIRLETYGIFLLFYSPLKFLIQIVCFFKEIIWQILEWCLQVQRSVIKESLIIDKFNKFQSYVRFDLKSSRTIWNIINFNHWNIFSQFEPWKLLYSEFEIWNMYVLVYYLRMFLVAYVFIQFWLAFSL